MRLRSRAPLAACAAVVVLAAAGDAGAGSAALDAVQKEFKAAMEKATPATVLVVPVDGESICSGVLVSKSGLVVSDFDACQVVRRRGGETRPTDRVKIRVPDVKTGGFAEFDGRVLRSSAALDSTLIQVEKPPAGGFRSWLQPGTAADLRVGSFTFACGSTEVEGLPTMTAGVVAGVTYLPRGEVSGKFGSIYTGAAVNPGMQGGPLLDVHGRLVGVISGFEPIVPDDPYQLLGRVTPIDRLRAEYAALPEAKGVFGDKPVPPLPAPESEALETVIEHAGAGAYPSVASLVIDRTTPLNGMTIGGEGKVISLPRYTGPASAVVISPDGWLVTSLYNLTNLTSILAVGAGARLPAEAKSQAGLASITRITAVFADATSAPATLVAYHEGLGIALLKAETAGRAPLPPAPAGSYAPGRFLVPVANPYGTKPLPDPLVNFGIVSKRHADDAFEPWFGELQTDAGTTDANVGAAVVDVEGRLVGVLTMWNPVQHGRNSGISFVVPWDRIEPALESLKQGRTHRLPRLGVEWQTQDGRTVIHATDTGGPADSGGILPGDVCVRIAGVDVKTMPECIRQVRRFAAGDKVEFVVDRDGEPKTFTIELGSRD